MSTVIAGVYILLGGLCLLVAVLPRRRERRWVPPLRCIERMPVQGIYLKCDRIAAHEGDHFNVESGKRWPQLDQAELDLRRRERVAQLAVGRGLA